MKTMSQLLAVILMLLFTGCGQKNDTVFLSSMIGKNIRGDEIQGWLSKVEDTPEIGKYDDSFYYSFKQKGVSLRFDTTETLTNIFLYSEGADGYRQYQGKLPYNLSFLLNRQEIENMLDKPEKSGGEGVINYWVVYTSKGVGITYNTKQTDDLNARIYVMYINNIR